MLFVGLDIHTKHISICVLSEAGQVTHRSRVRNIEQMLQILKGLPDRFEVCYEASCGYGYFHDLLQPLAARVRVAHPGQLRLIFRSKNKNDRNDAERLAKVRPSDVNVRHNTASTCPLKGRTQHERQ
jgi:hypothetical protein